MKKNVRELLASPESEQRDQGYFHTLREIRQQPTTWADTCERMLGNAALVSRACEGIRMLVLTGSGSSQFAGDCVRLALQAETGVATDVVGGGTLLTHGPAAIPPERPALMISLARSGNSPESVAAVALMLEREPQIRHLVITCNRDGKLATAYRGDARVEAIVLDDRTNDRSLVMTSSFTNMALAARFAGMFHAPDRYRQLCQRLSRACGQILGEQIETVAAAAESGFARAVFLGSGSREGAARECALKMLEMTAGRVATIHETYLGLRHGPMSYIHDDTLVVSFLSSDPGLRAYETDLIRELDRKRLGRAKLIFGEDVPEDLARKGDWTIECPGLAEIGDENAAVLNVVVGQLLGTFRCLAEGLRPDSPSESGVISRVVESFPLHQSAGRTR